MTFAKIVTRIMEKLNYRTDEAQARIEDTVNDYYKELTSSLGLDTSRRTTTDFSIISTSPSYTTLPEIQFEEFEKIISILYIPSGTNPQPQVLEQITYDSMLQLPTEGRVPQRWAVKSANANSVTVLLDGYPAATTFTLRVTGTGLASTLDGIDEPSFAESFHNALYWATLMDEYIRLEKGQLATLASSRYEKRLSDLRLFIAKSAFMDIQQGKDNPLRPNQLRRQI
jgi:hypothetical protein